MLIKDEAINVMICCIVVLCPHRSLAALQKHITARNMVTKNKLNTHILVSVLPSKCTGNGLSMCKTTYFELKCPYFSMRS